MVEKKGLYLIAVLILFLSVSFVSAGFVDWITGNAVSGPTNVSINVKGANQCKLSYVYNVTQITAVENTMVPVTFSVQVFDQDGFNDINQSSVFANFTYSVNPAETRSTASNCAWVNNIAPKTANFSCTINMQYWDGAGNWNITVIGNDLGNKSVCTNSSTSFAYTIDYAMVISPSALSWASLNSGSLNQTAVAPTVVNNTGNFNGTILINGIHLHGETNNTEYLDVSNFTSSPNSGVASCIGTTLVNGSNTAITGAFANRGNLSAGSGQRSLYYCIPTVPPLTTQTYSTTKAGSWTVAYQ